MKKVFALVMAAVMVVAMFAGCGSSAPKAEEAGAIELGMCGPLTGGAAVYGTAVQAGMELPWKRSTPMAACSLN